ncbi:cytochrome c [Azospirillum brasilense]|uniref:Cytochrome c n=1 Tax=Azospirillum brasilense TaxID=192 RepID=A0A0P0ER82_AZOBR|nr:MULTISPECIES: cytochrome c [Azospirillum]ALJ34525.1 cytochrome C [Azospirillum brasilense]MDW7554127.1 cytochrome c [Azospirillum brasilense]MDW7592906.1 cytochrome c [Azospirillum brasilense]MDW7593614.1 cytochrome c [Azospirillum brasilense]MDW7627143.1 cytochrome c [Azospirillum brasilense]
MLTRVTLAAMAALLLVGVGVGGTAMAQDPIKARKDGFEANKKAMAEIKDLLGNDKVAQVGPVAQRMSAFGAQIPTLFPAGSDKGDTKAKADIWANNADFAAKAQAFEAAAKGLEAAAASGDKAATAKQFAAVGGTCKACHENYRAD